MLKDIYNFCTYFDTNYLTRGLALEHSLHSHCPQAVLWILCMDSLCYESLLKLNLSNVNLIRREDFERGDEELAGARKDRTPVEYYFTCTPSILLYLFQHHLDMKLLTYIDSDFFFFSDPTEILLDVAKYSISITPHRFPTNLRFLERSYGVYNVGWITFARDEEGMSCLKSWRKQCIEWCYDRVEEGRFGDQMYLDDWPSRFSNLKIIHHIGVNLAPYNLANYKITLREGRISVNQSSLICFHFFGLKSYRGFIFYLPLNRYAAQPTRTLIERIYEPYLQSLNKIQKEIQAILSTTTWAKSIRGITRKGADFEPLSARRFFNKLTHWVAVGSAIYHRRFVLFSHGRIRCKLITCGLRGRRL